MNKKLIFSIFVLSFMQLMYGSVPRENLTTQEVSELPDVQGKNLCARSYLFCLSLCREDTVVVYQAYKSPTFVGYRTLERVKTWQEKYEEHFLLHPSDKKNN